MKINRKQLGSKNKKANIGRKSAGSKTLNPWGKAVPTRLKGSRGKVSGSSTRESKSSPALAPQTKGYPKNQPSQWPVIPDYAGHTRTPSLSGVTTSTAASHNAAVEHAYTRAGYQSSP